MNMAAAAADAALVAAIEAAHLRIRPLVLLTPLIRSYALSSQLNANVALKCDSEQRTGSFKLRGAANKVALLLGRSAPSTPSRGLITASTGNHALAMATAIENANEASIEAQIVLPTTAAKGKVEALRRFKGIELIFHGTDCTDAENLARKTATETGKVFVSPYNDLEYARAVWAFG